MWCQRTPASLIDLVNRVQSPVEKKWLVRLSQAWMVKQAGFRFDSLPKVERHILSMIGRTAIDMTGRCAINPGKYVFAVIQDGSKRINLVMAVHNQPTNATLRMISIEATYFDFARLRHGAKSEDRTMAHPSHKAHIHGCKAHPWCLLPGDRSN